MNKEHSAAVLKAKGRYQHVIDNIDQLPSLPAIVSRLLQVVNCPDTSAEDAAELIEKDPALTSRMLRLANSAFYGIPRSISSVSSAVVILGFNTIRSLVLSASVVKMFSGAKPFFDNDRFWKHSIVTAIASKTIIRHFMSVRMMDPESAFCSGILHDIGKLIFSFYVPEEYMEACEYACKHSVSLIDAENHILGINHAEIGKILADKWALPLDLSNCLVYHHSPEKSDIASDLVSTVHLGDIMAHKLGCDLWDGEIRVEESASSREILNISQTEYDKIMDKLQDSVEKSTEFLSIIK
ncbi:metal dependent phosphohydrolase [Chitinispirillum alkaliphilum]|nr:metal dependent phosphohydrolase [Chitinispirillum alkaliphilum]